MFQIFCLKFKALFIRPTIFLFYVILREVSETKVRALLNLLNYEGFLWINLIPASQ